MRRHSISIILIAFSLVVCAIARDETLEQMKARFEKTHTADRPPLGIKIAEQQLHNAGKLYYEGKVDEGRAAIDDVVLYSEKARDAATQTNKHVKNIEIDARKMAERLRDLKRTLAYEDQPPVEQAIRRMEDIRTSLLDEMFKGEKKDEKEKQ